MRLIILLSLLPLLVTAANYATYPQVPKTATINGFADPIYGKLPSCAEECVKASTGNTPCPYWDTGCLCVMPQWSGQVAQCVAQSCSGSDVELVASLATSLCASVGANTWMMPASISSELSSAAGNVKNAKTTEVSTSSASASSNKLTSSNIAEKTSGTAATTSPTIISSKSDSATTSGTTSTSSSNIANSSAAQALLLLFASFFSILA